MTEIWRNLVAMYDRFTFHLGCDWLASAFDIDLDDLDEATED